MLLVSPACAGAPPAWGADLVTELQAARTAGQDVAVYFALPDRELSDRMEEQALPDPVVLAALAAHGFRSLRVDAGRHGNLYRAWVGGGEGMGICVLDSVGRVYAARPGPQDPPELAAFLRLCALRREAIRAARTRLAADPRDAAAHHALGCVLLELGCRIGTEEHLVTAAQAGIGDAWHRLARLHALDGDVAAARKWLPNAPQTSFALVTEGYVLFKERRHAEAVAVLQQALQRGGLDQDRQRALLYLGKSLHECGRGPEAVHVLRMMAAEGTGSTFEAAALHALRHLQDPSHGHSH